MEYDKQIRYNDSQMERYQAYISRVQKINRLDKRTKEMTIGDVIKKSILPLAFMVFSQIYTPCVTALGTIKKETNSWKWMFFAAGYMFALAWVVSLLVYQIGTALGF